MKTKLIITLCVSLSCFLQMSSQNASDDQNNASIGGTNCSAYGFDALQANTGAGSNNSALGHSALYSNTTGSENTAAGYEALYNNNANANTAVGKDALWTNSSGINNTAIGVEALEDTDADNNTGMGYRAGWSNGAGTENTAFGYLANFSVPNDVNQTAIGAFALTTQSDMVRLGDANIAVLSSFGASISLGSDGRFKSNISEEDVKGLEFIRLLRPVSYNMNTRKKTEFTTKTLPHELRAMYLNKDFSASTTTRRSGFIAQEVEAAMTNTGYDFDGLHKPQNDHSTYSIVYESFVVPLVKAIQEQQRIIEGYNEQVHLIDKLLEEQYDEEASAQAGLMSDFFEPGFNLEYQKNAETKHTLDITVRFPENVNDASLGIYDLDGKQVFYAGQLKKGSSLFIPFESPGPGIYLGSIIINGSIAGSKKILVE